MVTCVKNIAKGVSIKYIKTDKFKTNYISFNVIAPLSMETVHLNALIPLILMRGTKNYPTQQLINKKLQYLYSGDISAGGRKYGEYQIFGIKANMLNNRYVNDMDLTNETVDLICEMIFEPHLVEGVFDKEYTENEKTNLIDMIEAQINNKGSYANIRLISEMCKDEIYSVPTYGTVENIEKVTNASLYEAYKNALQRYPIEIYFVGDGDFDAIAKKFEESFSKIKREVISIPEAPIVTEVKEVKEIVETENVKQGKLVLGFRTGYDVSERKYHQMQLFNEIFGASPTAKLFMNVREKMSLCYYCRSSVTQRSGIMTVASGIEVKNKEIAQKAILDQLEQIQRGEITKEELESAKKSIRNGYLQIYDSASAMAEWVFNRGLCGVYTSPIDECKMIDETTVDEIVNLSRKIKLDTVYFLKGEEGEKDNA